MSQDPALMRSVNQSTITREFIRTWERKRRRKRRRQIRRRVKQARSKRKGRKIQTDRRATSKRRRM